MGIGRSELLDWSNVLDDMDGGDWAEFFAASEPDDDVLEKQYERELECEYELEQEETEDRLAEISMTATLGDLAELKCSIEAQCLECHHRAMLNPKDLLRKAKPDATIRAIETRLRCQECGARNAIANFDSEVLNG